MERSSTGVITWGDHAFLFWNVGVAKRGNRPGAANAGLIDQIARLAGAQRPDVLTLIEFGDPFPTQQILRRQLRGRTGVRYYFHPTNVTGLAHFAVRFQGRFRQVSALPHGRSPRYDLHRVVGAQREILLVSVHGPSKLQRPDQDQQLFLGQLARQVEQVGNRLQVPSVVLGDLNADPYEPAVAGIQHLHGTMTRVLATPTRRRLVFGLGNPALYNPMWSLFGDRTAGPPGTYYFNRGRAYQAYWHMFDQVLLDRRLIDPVDHLRHVEIIARIGPSENLVNLLLKKRKPDHLPVVLELDL